MKTAARITGLATAFLIGAALAIALVSLVGAWNAFRAWGAIALVIAVVFLWGAHGSARTGDAESEISNLTFQSGRQTLQAACRDQDEKNWQTGKELSSDPDHERRRELSKSAAGMDVKQACWEEIDRRARISKTR